MPVEFRQLRKSDISISLGHSLTQETIDFLLKKQILCVRSPKNQAFDLDSEIEYGLSHTSYYDQEQKIYREYWQDTRWGCPFSQNQESFLIATPIALAWDVNKQTLTIDHLLCSPTASTAVQLILSPEATHWAITAWAKVNGDPANVMSEQRAFVWNSEEKKLSVPAQNAISSKMLRHLETIWNQPGVFQSWFHHHPLWQFAYYGISRFQENWVQSPIKHNLERLNTHLLVADPKSTPPPLLQFSEEEFFDACACRGLSFYMQTAHPHPEEQIHLETLKGLALKNEIQGDSPPQMNTWHYSALPSWIGPTLALRALRAIQVTEQQLLINPGNALNFFKQNQALFSDVRLLIDQLQPDSLIPSANKTPNYQDYSEKYQDTWQIHFIKASENLIKTAMQAHNQNSTQFVDSPNSLNSLDSVPPPTPYQQIINLSLLSSFYARHVAESFLLALPPEEYTTAGAVLSLEPLQPNLESNEFSSIAADNWIKLESLAGWHPRYITNSLFLNAIQTQNTNYNINEIQNWLDNQQQEDDPKYLGLFVYTHNQKNISFTGLSIQNFDTLNALARQYADAHKILPVLPRGILDNLQPRKRLDTIVTCLENLLKTAKESEVMFDILEEKLSLQTPKLTFVSWCQKSLEQLSWIEKTLQEPNAHLQFVELVQHSTQQSRPKRQYSGSQLDSYE